MTTQDSGGFFSGNTPAPKSSVEYDLALLGFLWLPLHSQLPGEGDGTSCAIPSAIPAQALGSIAVLENQVVPYLPTVMIQWAFGSDSCEDCGLK